MTKAERLILNYQNAYTDPVTGHHSPVLVKEARKAILAYHFTKEEKLHGRAKKAGETEGEGS